MRVWTAQDGVLLCDGREILLRRDYRTTYAEGAAEVQWIADACDAAEQKAEIEENGYPPPDPDSPLYPIWKDQQDMMGAAMRRALQQAVTPLPEGGFNVHIEGRVTPDVDRTQKL